MFGLSPVKVATALCAFLVAAGQVQSLRADTALVEGVTAAIMASDAEMLSSMMADPAFRIAELLEGEYAFLHLAAMVGDPAIVEALLEAGAEIDPIDGVNGWTPLMHATHQGHEAAVRLLLERGANQHVTGTDLSTAAILARYSGLAELYQSGMALGGTSEPVNQTRLDELLLRAAEAGDMDLVEALIDQGADANAMSEAGWTPQLFAASRHDLEMLVYLSGQGATAQQDQQVSLVEAALLGATLGESTSADAGLFIEHVAAMAPTSSLPEYRELATQLGLGAEIDLILTTVAAPTGSFETRCLRGEAADCAALLTSVGPAATEPEADRLIATLLSAPLPRADLATTVTTALEQGVERPLIRALQRRLAAEAGYRGGIDGLAGPQTRAALDRWAVAGERRLEVEPVVEPVTTPLPDTTGADWGGLADWSQARAEALGRIAGAGEDTRATCLVTTPDGVLFLGIVSRMVRATTTLLFAPDALDRPVAVIDATPQYNDCPTAFDGWRPQIATLEFVRMRTSVQGQAEPLIHPVVTLWDASNGESVSRHVTARGFESIHHGLEVTLALAADGSAFVITTYTPDQDVLHAQLWASGADMSHASWDVPITDRTRFGAVDHVFSANGQRLAHVDEGAVVVRDVASGIVLQRLPVPTTEGFALFFAADDTRVVWSQRSHYADKESFFEPDYEEPTNRKLVIGWDTETWQEAFHVYDAPSEYVADTANGAALSPDGRRLAVWNAETGIHVWDMRDGQLIGQSAEPFQGLLQFSLDGSLLLGIPRHGYAISMFRADGVQFLTMLPVPESGGPADDWLRDVAFSPDGDALYGLGNTGHGIRWSR